MAEISILATGDSFITRPIPEGGYPGFDRIAALIDTYDVKFNNLEITVHRQQGYPAAVSGGTWAMTSPEVLDDLNRFGFNLYNTANNHSCDFSCGGVTKTIENLNHCHKAYAGTGTTLDDASAPGYVTVNGCRVALLGACSTCDASAVAGNANGVMTGRPGLNPLRYENIYLVEEPYFSLLGQIGEKTAINAQEEKGIANGYYNPWPEGTLHFGGSSFLRSDHSGMTSVPNEKDMARMEAGIRQAKENADCVLVSIHCHEFDGRDDLQPPDFLKTFAKRCVDAGADAVLGHGPHELRGIEIYREKPIFYSLGNFLFQTETVESQPADAYENKGLDKNSSVQQLMDLRSRNGTRGYCVQENIWRSVMAGFRFENGNISDITLHPITLNMHLPRNEMGWPCLTEDEGVLYHLQDLSRPFGTQIVIQDGVGRI